MRRVDRAMPSEDAIEALLLEAQVGFIATCAQDQPFIHSNYFWYDKAGHSIYFHTAIEGRTRDNIIRNPRVCFSTAKAGRLLPAKTALEFSTEYAGVCAFGQARIVERADEAEYALQGLLDKYFPDLIPGKDYRPITQEEIAITSVFAIEIEAWSGKEKIAPE